MNGLTKIKGFAQFTMIMVGLIFFAGCKKENGDYAEAPSTRFDASINTSIVQYALSLASSLEDVECRNLVKTEALKKFDGDYDVLASTLQNKIVENKKMPYSAILSKNIEKLGITNGIKFLKSINSTIPNLQISVPLKCDGMTKTRLMNRETSYGSLFGSIIH